MASIANDPNGRRRILFVDTDGSRKPIRLGKVSKADAQSICFRVEQLLAAKLTGRALDADTASWVAKLTPAMAGKLAQVGLIADPQAKPSTGLDAFIEKYTTGRAKLKSNTARNYGQTRGYLVKHFGPLRTLESITPGDADGWREWLVSSGKAQATVSREVKRARQFFRAAMRLRLIAENPFADVKAGARDNRGRQHFVTRDVAEKVLAACPDAEWRLIFALARYGGLRTPSETLALRWRDIDWAQDRMTVPSSKTAHCGKASRVVPLFPELRKYLDEAWELPATAGTEYVINRYRGAEVNLRTQLERIIAKAGVKPWPKPFQNLRSTRETQLAEQFPIHVVTEWIGNSAAVAAKHYLQVTDEHFATAANVAAEKSGAESGALEAQNEAQSTIGENCPESDEVLEVVASSDVRRLPVIVANGGEEWSVPPRCTGLE